MKKSYLILSLVAAFGFASVSMAQVAGPKGAAPKQEAGKHLGRGELRKVEAEILAKLNLTSDQKAKFRAHAEELKKKGPELRKSLKGASAEERKAKMKEFREKNQAFLKATLTKDQLKEFVKLRRLKMKELREKNNPPKG